MKLFLRYGFSCLFAVALAAPLAAAPMDMSGHDMPGHDMSGHDRPANPADTAFLKAMDDMMRGMHQSVASGETDVDFARFMLPHHQAAIDMAKTELQYGKDPELRQLATAIVAAQDKEIAQMKAWLAKHAK